MAFTEFAFAYDEQNAHDHGQLAQAIEDGRVDAVPGWPWTERHPSGGVE